MDQTGGFAASSWLVRQVASITKQQKRLSSGGYHLHFCPLGKKYKRESKRSDKEAHHRPKVLVCPSLLSNKIKYSGKKEGGCNRYSPQKDLFHIQSLTIY
jgi:hypothetical protein